MVRKKCFGRKYQTNLTTSLKKTQKGGPAPETKHKGEERARNNTNYRISQKKLH